MSDSDPSINPITEKVVSRLSKTIHVVLLKNADGRLELLMDPGLNKPWMANSSNVLRNRKMADFQAKAHDGMAASWEDAFRLLKADDPHFEHRLHERVESAMNQFKLPHGQSVATPESQPVQQSGIVLDAKGNPTPNGNN